MADRFDNGPRRKPNKNRNKRKNSFAIFYVITMIVGVVVCVTLFALAYQTLIPPRIISAEPGPGPASPVDFTRPETDQVLGMVTDINTFAPRNLSVLILETGRTEQFNMTDATSVQSRHGTPIGFGEINLGQIVDVVFDVDNRNMSSITLSPHATEQQHRGNVNVNIENSAITIGNEVFEFSSRTLVLDRHEEPFPISLVTPEDLVTVVSYQNKIWSIRIDGGHGFIRFENADRVVNGTVLIGNTTFVALDDNRSISVIEGTHRITVDGLNIIPFVADVVVRQGQSQVVNLADVVFRTGTLQIILPDPELSVFINGDEVTLENFVTEIEFGTHLIRVEGPGFVPIQQEFEMTQTFMRLDLDLVRDVETFQVLVETFPSDAQLFLNGVLVGNSPRTVEVERGINQIIARRAGYEDRPHNFIVDSASPMHILLHLVQLPTQLPPFPSPSPFPPGHQEPPTGPGYLPPLPPDWGPIPTPPILEPWEPLPPGQQLPGQQLPGQQLPGQQLPLPTYPPPSQLPAVPTDPSITQPTLPEQTVPDWPPPADALPLPLGS